MTYQWMNRGSIAPIKGRQRTPERDRPRTGEERRDEGEDGNGKIAAVNRVQMLPTSMNGEIGDGPTTADGEKDGGG